MVFIHGGGFEEGSSRTDLMGPEFFMTEDIVLVTLNYRVGILGIKTSIYLWNLICTKDIYLSQGF